MIPELLLSPFHKRNKEGNRFPQSHIDDNEQSLESVMEGDECTVCFNGKWYHSRDDFFKDGCIDNMKLTAIYEDLYGFEVE